MNSDFLRSLHTRLFSSFASLGFDDHAWPSTQDLQWIVTQGQADLAKADGEVKQLEAQKCSQDAKGKSFEEKPLKNASKVLAELRLKVNPFKDELARRHSEEQACAEQSSEIAPHETATPGA